MLQLAQWKLALKVLARRKFFTFISLFGIAFTLLVLLLATALFDHLFASHPPETRSDRTLLVMAMKMSGPQSSRTSFAGYAFLDRHVRTLPDVEAVAIATLPDLVTSWVDGVKVKSFVRRTDGAFWRILDFEFVEGGPFDATHDQAGDRVAVINQTTRQRFFGDREGEQDGDRDASKDTIGREIELDGRRFRVIGVVRDVPMTRVVPFADIWVPHGTALADSYKREWVGDMMGIILARDAGDVGRIQADVRDRAAAVQLPDPKQFDRLDAAAETLFDAFTRMMLGQADGPSPAPRVRFMLVVGVLLFMALPALNLVNINLSRILERSSEIGVRKSFGASSVRLVGQFVFENVVLTLVGGALGLILAWAVLNGIEASGVIPYAVLDLNWRIAAIGLILTLLFGLLSGTYPAWRMARMHPAAAVSGRPQ